MPDIEGFRRLARSLATLDAVLSPEWQYRYYSFNSIWDDGEMMASMRDGSGDNWFALLSPHGIALHGLVHEAPMFRPEHPWPGIFDSVPPQFSDFVKEPAFDSKNTSFCIWRTVNSGHWERGALDYAPGSDPDGSERLLAIFDADPEAYAGWAETYYEVKVDRASVEAIYQHSQLSEELVRSLNPDLAPGDLREDMREIGYPEAG